MVVVAVAAADIEETRAVVVGTAAVES